MANAEQNIGAIIFSRFDSSRLFGKALTKINGQELLGRVIERTSHIRNLGQIVIATSNRIIDAPIVEYSQSMGFETYRGSLENVALRAAETCDQFGFDAFLRVCGDRPFFDPYIASKVLMDYRLKNCDLSTTTGQTSLPEGLTCEVMNAKTLKNHVNDFDEYEREHVTSFFYRNSNKFDISHVEFSDFKKFFGKTKLVIDDDLDLRRAEEIASKADNLPIEKRFSAQVNLEFAINWERQRPKGQ